jgi:hypothetical protein
MTTFGLTKHATKATIKNKRNAKRGFSPLAAQMRGNARETRPSTSQFNKKHIGTKLGYKVSAMYSQGTGPMMEDSINLTTKKPIRRITLRTNEFYSTFVKSYFQKMRVISNKLAMAT